MSQEKINRYLFHILIMAESYIVLGPPRTGTSLTMGTLAAMGVWVGENMRKGSNNPNYYEAVEIQKFIHGRISAEKLVSSLRKEPKWGMKHPRLIVRWDELEPLIESPHFIITHRRDFQAQCKSHCIAIRRQTNRAIRKRNLQYYDRVNEIVRDRPRLDVWFEDWFLEEYVQLHAIAKFAKVEITEAAKSLPDPRLKHY